MLAKLAVRNIRRSVRDYAIYFVTLVFGVAVFYAFNSIQSQSILFDLQGEASASMFQLTGNVLTMFSVVIAAVLGFLIIYANRFLIKRRKQEFGIYLMLGMKPSKVSAIVLIEAFLVGLVSLVVGIAIGIVLSQALSFATAALFEITMVQYQFVFSPSSLVITLVSFAGIYVIVALFNTFTVRRYKLIDLMVARNKSERQHMRNPKLCVVLFIVSLAILAAAYCLLIDNGLVYFDKQFALSTVLMVVGTFLFFYSVAGFVITLIQKSNSVYLKKLRVFTVRQIASKFNTASISIAVMCILMFFSVTVFSIGMGMVDVFTGDTKNLSRYDATIASMPSIVEENAANPESTPEASTLLDEMHAYDYSIEQRISEHSDTWDDVVARSAQVDVYVVQDFTFQQLFDQVDETIPLDKDNDLAFLDSNVLVVGVSQYNETRALIGEDPIELGDNEYAVNCNVEMGKAAAAKLAASDEPRSIAGFELTSAYDKPFSLSLTNAMFAGDFEVVVPDELIAIFGTDAPYNSILNVMYVADRISGDELLNKAITEACPPSDKALANGSTYEPAMWPVYTVFTGQDVVSQSGGMRMMISYLALYIGFVLLIATAAMLAIQQLSETSDSVDRYRTLSQIGCDDAMIMKSLRTQTLVYFLAPLALAICHSACAIGTISSTMFTSLGTSVLGPALMATALVIVVYGAYLLLTYGASRTLVKNAISRKRR